jgi:hypothetical protein
MRILLAVTVATVCFAATEARVSRATLMAVENSINEKLSAYTAEPYDVLGTARGTYLEGYGALFTTELDLINAGPLNVSPFKPTISKEEIATTKERKLKKLVVLRETMRGLMMNASGTLEGLPPNEHVAMEAILFNYSWEDSKAIPHRVFMSADRKKLMDAKAGHAGPTELAAIIEEQDQ